MTEQVVQDDLTTVHGPKGFLSEHHLDRYENWLDSRLRIPGTNFTFGLDGIIGLVPVVGDIAGAGISAVFIADAWKMGARKRVLARMAGNVGLDLTLGAIPLVGDLFDFVFKSNVKNLKLHRAERQRLTSLE
jgi:hypothetical protein